MYVWPRVSVLCDVHTLKEAPAIILWASVLQKI